MTLATLLSTISLASEAPFVTHIDIPSLTYHDSQNAKEMQLFVCYPTEIRYNSTRNWYEFGYASVSLEAAVADTNTATFSLSSDLLLAAHCSTLFLVAQDSQGNKSSITSVTGYQNEFTLVPVVYSPCTKKQLLL